MTDHIASWDVEFDEHLPMDAPIVPSETPRPSLGELATLLGQVKPAVKLVSRHLVPRLHHLMHEQEFPGVLGLVDMVWDTLSLIPKDVWAVIGMVELLAFTVDELISHHEKVSLGDLLTELGNRYIAQFHNTSPSE